MSTASTVISKSKAAIVPRLNVNFANVFTVLAKSILVLTIAAVWISTARAETVLACAEAWGSSESCGGCSGMTWQTPAANLKVKTSANDFWTLLSNLKPTDSVSTSSQAPGTIATCAQVTGKKTVAELLITAPTPPVVTPPASGDGTATVTWTAPTLDVDKKPITPTGYNLYWGTNPASLTKISLPITPLSYTLSSLASGTYYFAMTTCIADCLKENESARTNFASKSVIATGGNPTSPPVVPVPQPIPGPVVTVAGGTWAAKKGSTNLKSDLASHDDCLAYLKTQAVGKYSCAFSGEIVTVKIP